MSFFKRFSTSEQDIINNKKIGCIYVADFPMSNGKYISITEYGEEDAPDMDIKISTRIRIQLRFTYLTSTEKISGVEISKVTWTKIEKIHFSTLDFQGILQLLKIFSELDLKSITNKNITLDESIIGNSEEVIRFLELIASDPEWKNLIGEVAKNLWLIKTGDIDNMAHKKETVSLFEKILNDEQKFSIYKEELSVGKDEEVWQQFFSRNSWILGSDFIEILEERRLDVGNITDYLLKSFDGFVDIIELKLPNAPFWTADKAPRSELTSASMQCNWYILQTERKINDLEFSKKIQYTQVVKPKITLVYGRSNTWNTDESEAYRVLNSSYSNLKIITYDHLLERAKRMINTDLIETNDEIDTFIVPF